MNINEIEELLDKYYEGETSLEEERILKDFFLSESVPMELAVHKSQFQYFAEASCDEMSDQELEEKVFKGRMDIPVVSIHSRRNRFYYITGIAATLLLLIGLVFTFQEDFVNKPAGSGTVNNDPEVAFSQACDILAMVSVNFNKGIDKMQYLGQFEKAIQKTQMLSKFYQYETLIINPDPDTRMSIKSDKQ